jgi:acyl-CoA reductase-like NAD-dependent aldehyde dehydrogenase
VARRRRGGTIAVEDPATGETLIEVADATVDDAKAALGAAHESFQEWREHRRASARTSCGARSRSSPSAPTTSRC